MKSDRELVDEAVGRARSMLAAWRRSLAALPWRRPLAAAVRESGPDPQDPGALLALRALALAAPRVARLRDDRWGPGELAALCAASEVLAASVREIPESDGAALSRALAWGGDWADTLLAAALGSVGAAKGLPDIEIGGIAASMSCFAAERKAAG